MSIYGCPFIGSIKQVEDGWIDYNGHFNMAYYAVLFDRTADEAFDLVGLGPDYANQTKCSFFTLEAHLTYAQELAAGDKVKVSLQMIDYDTKRMHYIQQMHHSEEGWLSATMEAICMHVDLGARKSAPFPTTIHDKIAAMTKAHEACPKPPQLGHKIGIIRK